MTVSAVADRKHLTEVLPRQHDEVRAIPAGLRAKEGPVHRPDLRGLVGILDRILRRRLPAVGRRAHASISVELSRTCQAGNRLLLGPDLDLPGNRNIAWRAGRVPAYDHTHLPLHISRPLLPRHQRKRPSPEPGLAYGCVMRSDASAQRGGEGRDPPQDHVPPRDRLPLRDPRLDLAAHAAGDGDVLAGHRDERRGAVGGGGAAVLLRDGRGDAHRQRGERGEAGIPHGFISYQDLRSRGGGIQGGARSSAVAVKDAGPLQSGPALGESPNANVAPYVPAGALKGGAN